MSGHSFLASPLAVGLLFCPSAQYDVADLSRQVTKPANVCMFDINQQACLGTITLTYHCTDLFMKNTSASEFAAINLYHNAHNTPLVLLIIGRYTATPLAITASNKGNL